MYQQTIEYFAAMAEKKVKLVRYAPTSFWISAMMAGAYIGLGIILILTVGEEVPHEWRRLVMGASFGVALVLVVFAGSELFTGHTMYLTIGWLERRVTLRQVGWTWVMVWLGNLAGGALLAVIFVTGGGANLLHDSHSILYQIASYKMAGSAPALVARGMLCNWLVCLSLWMAARMDSDTAKCIGIFWCLFAFIAAGFEHSVANMTLLTVALMGEPNPAITLAGMVHNLIWVTLGNILSGMIFMGAGYWLANRSGQQVLQSTEPLASHTPASR